jgi:hypothetical protein
MGSPTEGTGDRETQRPMLPVGRRILGELIKNQKHTASPTENCVSLLRIAWQALHNKEHDKIKLRKAAGALFANDQQKQEH